MNLSVAPNAALPGKLRPGPAGEAMVAVPAKCSQPPVRLAEKPLWYHSSPPVTNRSTARIVSNSAGEIIGNVVA